MTRYRDPYPVERARARAFQAADDGYHHDPREETFTEYVDRMRREEQP